MCTSKIASIVCFFSFLDLHKTSSLFFFFNDTATTEIYTLSLHDALPIWSNVRWARASPPAAATSGKNSTVYRVSDRKSTRLNSSHSQISYAVFCLKKKNIKPMILDSHIPPLPIILRIVCEYINHYAHTAY